MGYVSLRGCAGLGGDKAGDRHQDCGLVDDPPSLKLRRGKSAG